MDWEWPSEKVGYATTRSWQRNCDYTLSGAIDLT